MQWLKSYEADFGTVEGSGMLRVCHSVNPANEVPWSTTGAAMRNFEAGTNVAPTTEPSAPMGGGVWLGWMGRGFELKVRLVKKTAGVQGSDVATCE